MIGMRQFMAQTAQFGPRRLRGRRSKPGRRVSQRMPQVPRQAGVL